MGGACLQASQRAIWGWVRSKKKYLGGFTRKFLAGWAAGLIPTGAADLNGLAPAVIEAVNCYAKAVSAKCFVFGFPLGRAIRRGPHLLQQISVTSAFPGVLGKWPLDKADLGEVRRGKVRRPRFQAHPREGSGRFRRRHARQ